MSDRVVCAAIRHSNGLVICGARHFDEIMVRQIEFGADLDWRTAEQGFINQRCEFLTREQAWGVAYAAQQIVRDAGWCTGMLHSEHLY